MTRTFPFLFRLLSITFLLTCTAGMVSAEQGAAEPKPAQEQWMTFYYRNPQPRRFPEEVRQMSKSGAFQNKNAQPPCIAFLSQVMAQNPSRIAGWMAALNDLPEEEKQQVLYPAIAYSQTAEGAKFFEENNLKQFQRKTPGILEMEVNNPEVLDMLWGCFMATGREEPVRRIVSAFNLSPYAGSLDKYKASKKTDDDKKAAYLDVTLRAACWSLQSFCKEHPRVREICEALLSRDSLNPVERRWLGAMLNPQESKSQGSAEQKNRKPFAEMPNWKGKDGFGAQLSLTEDEQFFKDWAKPEAPRLSVASKARRNIPLNTVLLFSNPGVGPDGGADVTANLKVLKPDGGVYIEEKDLVCWKGKYNASAQILQLAPWHMGIRIEPQDPAGIYSVEVTVRDNVKKVELPLQITFDVPK